MSESDNISLDGDMQLDWKTARGFLARRVARKLIREDQATLDDLTQEALVRLLRAARRETVNNVEALMERIAERTVVDFLRSRRIWQKQPTLDAQEIADDPRLGYTPPDAFGTPSVERIQFTTLEFFQLKNSSCYELAQHYFAGRNWLEVARVLDRPHTAIRQQWCRCVELLRAAARSDATWLWEWA